MNERVVVIGAGVMGRGIAEVSQPRPLPYNPCGCGSRSASLRG